MGNPFRLSILIATLLTCSFSWGKTANDNTLPEPLEAADPSTFTIDAGDLIKINAYDSATRSYQIVTVNDPTIEKIFASPESLAKAVRILNPEALQHSPVAIVGHDYTLDRPLVILWDFELEKRKADFKNKSN